jgi:hypothetical protein
MSFVSKAEKPEVQNFHCKKHKIKKIKEIKT